MRNILTALLVLLASSLSATTYYVDNANGNDGNTGLSEVQAYATLGTAEASAADGDIVYVQSGTDYTVEDEGSAILYTNTLGTVANGGISWIGYTTTPGDNGMVTMNAGLNGLTYCVYSNVNCQHFYNFIFTGASSGGLNLGSRDNCNVINCEANGNSGDGFNGDNFIYFENCYSHNNGGDGFDIDITGMVIRSMSIGNTGWGINPLGGASVIECVVVGNTAGGISTLATYDPLLLLHCTLDGDGSTTGVYITGAANWGIHASSNIIYNHATGLDVSVDIGRSFTQYNMNFYSNTLDRFRAGNDETDLALDPIFVDAAARNYEPTNQSLRLDSDWGTTTTAGVWIGAVPRDPDMPAAEDVESGVVYDDAYATGTLSASGGGPLVGPGRLAR